MHAQHLVEEQTLARMRFGTDIANVRRRLYKLERELTHRHKIRVIKAMVVDVVKERAKEKARAIINVMKARVVDVVKERAKEKARASIKVMISPALLSMEKL